MPWWRIDEHAMDHPKFLALSDGAWRLWCEGQSYCQKHLTNGRIPLAALKGFRYYSAGRLKNLLATIVLDKGPCWHLEGETVEVHDFLDWNDDRDTVLRNRQQSKERKQRWRTERHGSGNASGNASRNASPDAARNASKDATPLREVVCSSSGSSSSDLSPPKAEPAFVERRTASRTTDLEALRAGDFVERYAELHVKFRHGAPYVGKMHFDFQEALQLVKVYDDARLDKLAEVWFRTDHDFAENGTRTLAKFRSMASWCDERLRKAGL